jgi:hypothetical protein
MRGEDVGGPGSPSIYIPVSDISMVMGVSRRAVEAVFQSLFILTDLRVLLRITAPDHRLDEAQKAGVRDRITALRREVDAIEQELLK